MQHYNITISGRVQGVFFRTSAREQAAWLGINGFVQNRADGAVYIEAEGEEEAVKKLIAWCSRGPTHARVTDLKVVEGALQGFSDFTIAY